MNYDNEKEQEPYMGTIQASRVSSNPGAALFDSETRHGHFIMLRINTASRRRNLSSDWVHSEKQVVEVSLSEAQWATFISTLNMGDGTPCTIEWIRDVGKIDGPAMPDNRVDMFHDEMLDRLDQAKERLGALKNAPGISKKNQKEIEMIEQELTGNIGFVADQFGRHMEKYIAKAKTDVEAYMNAAIHRAGLAKLLGKEDSDTDKIEDHTDPTK